MNTTYSLICGLEVHAELKTASKMFCGCKNDPFHAEQPNSHTCPVCLGMPGALPVANRRAIEWVIKLGLALNCKINLFSKFDRKHYFYPDLAKGYQISQYDLPFCYDGYLDTKEGRVRIRRIHLEEDTGKLLHKTINGEKVSLIDFNRSGVPLVEIVTEPDIHTASQAKTYAKKLRQILRFMEIADCDMEQGGMRLEANISVQTPTEQETNQLPGYKVEVKNINSFRFLEQAIEFEVQRQSEVRRAGELPVQETRGFNSSKAETFSQRSKEEAEDYRYFPDPDLPPLRFSEAQIENWKNELPELPDTILKKWEREYRVKPQFGEQLLGTKEVAEWAEKVFAAAQKEKISPNELANALVNKKIPASEKDAPQTVVERFAQSVATETVDESELTAAIQTVIQQNPDAAERFRAGETKVLGFFMGQVMRQLGKKVDAKVVQQAVQTELRG